MSELKKAALAVACALPLVMTGCASAPPASSIRLAVSANDAKGEYVDGAPRTVQNPGPDTVSIIDLTSSRPRVIAEVEAPTSAVRPPLPVAVAPDESFALVTAATKLVGGKIAPNNVLSVIDLKASPPRVIQTLQAGMGAAGVSINRAGTLALVADRREGTVSVFTISGKALTAAGKVKVGDEKSGPTSVVITPDGKRALVTRSGDNGLVILSIDGSKVEATKRVFYAGLQPWSADITPDGAFVVISNMGRNQGDLDTVSVVDMRADPPRTVNTVTVGFGPEVIKVSPDGRWCAVVVLNGANRPASHPYHSAKGILVVFRRDGTQLTKVAETPINRWPQGVVFSGDSRTILVQNITEKNIQVFSFDGSSLRETARIPLKGGGAALRTAER